MLAWIFCLTLVSAGITCQDVCGLIGTCRNDPHAHGSYCKKWQTEKVCFGMYVKPIAQFPFFTVCYQPNDESCDDSIYEPLRCGNGIISTEIATALLAASQEVNPEPSNEGLAEPEAIEELPEVEVEVEILTAEQQSCMAQCTRPPEVIAESVLVDKCDSLCSGLSECNNDPHAHGSYCKTWNVPNVCFGLYNKKEGGYCYQPNNPNCDDSLLQPVGC